MYTITCDAVTLHNVNLGLMVISGKCKLEANKTGSLTFYVAKNHPYRNLIKKHKSEITLYQDDEALFYGRVLNIELDIDNLMYVECEGELSYLLDTIQRAKEYHLDGGDNNVIKVYLENLISNHNSQVPNDKKFVVGTVNVTDTNNYLYKITNYENTLNTINEDLIKKFGGYIRIRHENGIRYIDYLKESSTMSVQTIEFGKNIINFTQTISGENIYTALIPLGAKLSDTSGAVEKRLTIKSLTNTTTGNIVKKDDYIYDSEAVSKYGWIYKVEKWDDITIANNLLSKAKAKLLQNTSELMYLELTAIDLHNLNTGIDSFEIGNKIHCISTPHDIDIWLIVKSIDIDIDNPANTLIKLVPSIDSIAEEKSLTDKKDDSDKKVDKIENKLKENTPSDSDVDKKINDLKDWTDEYYVPRGSISDPSQYVTKSDLNTNNNALKDWTNNNYVPKTDLSLYAKISDVNTAFSQLATAIEGV